ncbi:Scr1 family TA system antitoxin-like transcriptional regulator [Micromonospora aurantiaca (nom. illeg.)]|uniref:Scr1 family TA system antitoxin-like transcriptional regulator n=1 Tax=Micromonospora aurantiaca (nom. illeg.) TaxID=47850 RepID=UPI00341186D4
MIENETGVFDYRHPHPEPTTVYRDSLTGALYLDKLSEVAAYSVRWRALEGLSLDADRSADLLATIAKEM